MRMLLAFFLLIPQFVSAKLIVAGIPEKPFRYYENKKAKGVDVEIIEAVFKKLGITDYEIRLLRSSKSLEAGWRKENGDFDIVFTYSEKDYRKKFLKYPKETHVYIAFKLFYLKENEGKFKFNSYEDLKGLKVGATKGFSYSPEFQEAIKKKIFYTDFVVKNHLNIEKLLNKRIDIVPLNFTGALYDANIGGYADKLAYFEKPVKSKPYYNTFSISSQKPELKRVYAEYDRILAEMKKNGELDAIFKKYGTAWK